MRSNQDEDDQLEGCSCSADSHCLNCCCAIRFGLNYDSFKCLNINQEAPIFECNSECSCSIETCTNRVSQHDDQSENVRIIKLPSKGFGVTVKNPLPLAGMYVGEYVGEVLLEDEAHQRIEVNKNFEHNYLLLFNEHRSNSVIKTFVDARYYANWTRFINHSCDPNLNVVPVRVDQSWPPKLVFFTRRAIAANEELTYRYGDEINTNLSKPCLCSSSNCQGFLPYQRAD